MILLPDRQTPKSESREGPCGRGQSLNPDQLRAVLFVTALLHTRRDLDYPTRARIISSVKAFDIYSRTDALHGVGGAFREEGISWVSRKSLTERAIDRAVTLAETWLNQGISVAFRREIRSPNPGSHDIGPVFFVKGDVTLLEKPAATVLNSRQPRPTGPSNRWIQVTKSMVASALARGFAIVSSYGTISYCILSLLSKGSPSIVVCDSVLPFMQPLENPEQFVAQYGDLFESETTLFLSQFPPGQVPPTRSRYAHRDHLVAALASVVVAGEIRPGGIMASVLETVSARGVPIEHPTAHTLGTNSRAAFTPGDAQDGQQRSVAHGDRKRAPRLSQTSDSLADTTKLPVKSVPAIGVRAGRFASREAAVRVPFADRLAGHSQYLVHYTRSWPGPWPGQSVAEYCESLLSELPDAGHSAFDTLVRILRQGVIRGSTRLNRGGFSVTCLTECLPSELLSLLEWRRGLIRWRFEPYGLAFRKEAMFKIGTRPVIYAVDAAFNELSPDLKYLFQLQDMDGKQWSSEREWRVRGDIRLIDFDQDAFFVIVRTVAEAAIIHEEFGYATALAGIGTDRPQCGGS